jgi:hypothetical protein
MLKAIDKTVAPFSVGLKNSMSAIKNYLVSAVRPTINGWMSEKSNDVHLAYLEMYKMSLASYRKFLQEPFEPILWTEETQDTDTYTVANWYEIKKLWESEPCNILWAGADTLMIKPTSLFGQFNEYRLFNYTDPRATPQFPHYFNDDLQYYPSTMSKDVWELGESLWSERENSPERLWGFDQSRHNHMFWSQNIPKDTVLRPDLFFQAFGIREIHPTVFEWHSQWNGFPIGNAHILHFAGSRGSAAVINIMKELSNQLGITL